VILLENSNEWNLSPAKELSSKKRKREKGREKRSKDSKAKEVKPQMKKLHVFERRKEKKKKRMKFTSCWERFYQKKKERGSYFPIVKNPMCGLIHTHTSFAFALPSIP
jgi:hypothetical protein